MKSILIIDDEEPVRKVLRVGLSEAGYSVHEADNGREGLEKFKQVNPDIVITDVRMPEMSGIDVTKRIKEMENGADVIVMTGHGSEDLVINALRSGASNYIKKPITFRELFSILDSLVLKRQRRQKFEVRKGIVTYEKKNLVIDNDVFKVWGTINQILFNIPQRVDDRSTEGMKLGLYEILINAIEHGNLAISFKEKSEFLHEGSYIKLIEERAAQANNLGKKVHISSTYNGRELKIKVRDQGMGFNYKELRSLTDFDPLKSSHGRGIFLASIYFDKVKYQEPGNVVTLTKRLKSI